MTDEIEAMAKRLEAYAKDQGGWHNIDETCAEAAAALRRLAGETFHRHSAHVAAEEERGAWKARTTPPASPAATDEEVARMVERLTKPVYTFHINEKGGPNITVEGENRFAMEREVSPLADAGREAADLLARVARERDEAQRELKLLGSACDKIRHNASVDRRELEARLAKAKEALDLYREAVQIDVKMEGPQFMGVNRSALKRAWEADRAALAAMEAGDGK